MWQTFPERMAHVRVGACSTFRWTEHVAFANKLEAKFLNGVCLGLRLGSYEMCIGTERFVWDVCIMEADAVR